MDKFFSFLNKIHLSVKMSFFQPKLCSFSIKNDFFFSQNYLFSFSDVDVAELRFGSFFPVPTFCVSGS